MYNKKIQIWCNKKITKNHVVPHSAYQIIKIMKWVTFSVSILEIVTQNYNLSLKTTCTLFIYIHPVSDFINILNFKNYRKFDNERYIWRYLSLKPLYWDGTLSAISLMSLYPLDSLSTLSWRLTPDETYHLII